MLLLYAQNCFIVSAQQLFAHFLLITRTTYLPSKPMHSINQWLQPGIILPPGGYLQHPKLFLIIITKGDTTGI